MRTTAKFGRCLAILSDTYNTNLVAVFFIEESSDAFVDGIINILDFRIDNLVGQDVFIYNILFCFSSYAF